MSDIDLFEEAAFVQSAFLCESCGTTLDSEEEIIGVKFPKDGWIECFAATAKAQGWQVWELGPLEFKQLCPACSKISQK